MTRDASSRLASPNDPLPLLTRLWFAFVAWYRVLSDGWYARDVLALEAGPPRARELPEPAEEEAPVSAKLASSAPATPIGGASLEALDGALQLLALLQREGRFVDFIQQDITSFGDSDVGAAARVVHEGCRKALGNHAEIVSVRSEAEGSPVVVDRSDQGRVKLTGAVGGEAPFRGVLRHRGWRVDALKLPQRVGSQDLRIVAPAEVEL